MENHNLDLKQLRQAANHHLLEMIRQFIPSARWDQAVVCDGLPFQAVCGDVWVNDEGTVFSLGFALLLEAEGNLVIHERTAGFGADVDEALRFAVTAWVSSVFVTAACLYDPEGHPGHLASSIERALPDGTGKNRIWQIVSSPATAFSLSANHQKNPADPPVTLSHLSPAIGGLAKLNQLHWIKVFIANNGTGFDIDCTRNNEKAPEINGLFNNFPWPNRDVKYIRQFHIMKPTETFGEHPEPLAAVAAPPVEKKKLFGFLSRK